MTESREPTEPPPAPSAANSGITRNSRPVAPSPSSFALIESATKTVLLSWYKTPCPLRLCDGRGQCPRPSSLSPVQLICRRADNCHSEQNGVTDETPCNHV